MGVLCSVAVSGIADGITRQVTYFGMVAGSSAAPGSVAAAVPPRCDSDGIIAAPAAAPSWRSSRRVSSVIVSTSLLGIMVRRMPHRRGSSARQ
jgi:hypothetical protein